MKVGVVTYWYGNSNYGMIMQCWALQQYLKKMGHEPYVIRFKPERPWYIRWAKWCIKYVMCMVSGKKRAEVRLEIYNNKRDKERGFEQFRREHLDFSERIYRNIQELRKNPPEAGCYIAGSDQIWCKDLVSDSNAIGYYLGFGDKETKKIAYAPSFGKMVYSSENMGKLHEALSFLDYISCRESKGVEVCKQLGFEAQKVVDPTLLLQSNIYETLCGSQVYDDYLFIYSVNIGKSDDIYWDDMRTIFPMKRVIVTPASGSVIGGELFGDTVEYIYATPGEWISFIKNARFIVTSSFHGVVFSILFNKKVAFVPIKGEFAATNNRIIGLLEDLGLENLIVKNAADYQRILDSVIDWKSVEKRKESLIKGSIEYLEKCI